MRITLVGYMGSGKTSIAQPLALSLGLDFFDLDTEIEKKTGYTITETIFNKGEIYFRQLERETLLEILQIDNCIISTGGGTPCYYNNMDLINNNSTSIYLQYGVNALYERLKNNKHKRPLIAHLEENALQEYIGKHLFERSNFYEKATITIKGLEKSTNEIVKEITQIVQ